MRVKRRSWIAQYDVCYGIYFKANGKPAPKKYFHMSNDTEFVKHLCCTKALSRTNGGWQTGMRQTAESRAEGGALKNCEASTHGLCTFQQ